MRCRNILTVGQSLFFFFFFLILIHRCIVSFFWKKIKEFVLCRLLNNTSLRSTVFTSFATWLTLLTPLSTGCTKYIWYVALYLQKEYFFFLYIIYTSFGFHGNYVRIVIAVVIRLFHGLLCARVTTVQSVKLERPYNNNKRTQNARA